MSAEIKIRKSDGLTTAWGGSDLHIELPLKVQSNTKCNGKLTAANGLTVDKVLKHNNSSGGYINGRNTVVKTATADNSSTELRSGAIYLPAGSLLRSITFVITTNLDYASSKTIGIRSGNDAASDATFCTLVADSFSSSGTDTAKAGAGKGTSSNATLQADLSGERALALSNLYQSAATELHVAAVLSGATNFVSGAVAFIVEFDYLGGN